MTKILLIDDHEVVRIGLKHIISSVLPSSSWGEASTPQKALQLIKRRQWDLVILEISVNNNRGLELLQEIKSARSDVPVLIVSVYAEEQFGLPAIKAGAAGYVEKARPAAEICTATNRVLQGGRHISASFAETLTSDLYRRLSLPIEQLLSDREFQVLRLIGSGKTVTEIAAMLALSDKTVSTYRARVLDKTGLRNNAEIVRYVVEHHLVG